MLFRHGKEDEIIMEDIIHLLIERKETISTMESCTGGGIANAITNVSDSSKVFSFGAVTYANEYKIKFGVDKNIIDKYSVYSMETADSMSKNIALYTMATYGVGVTGKLMAKDMNNLYGEDDVVYLSVYDRENEKYYRKRITVTSDNRAMNKNIIIEDLAKLLRDVINEKNK